MNRRKVIIIGLGAQSHALLAHRLAELGMADQVELVDKIEPQTLEVPELPKIIRDYKIHQQFTQEPFFEHTGADFFRGMSSRERKRIVKRTKR